MASKSRVIYVGMTNELRARVFQHKTGRHEGFTKQYRVHRLVYFESYRYVRRAIAREKEIKGWRREKKTALIHAINPTWEDLAAGWFTAQELAPDPNAPVEMKHDSAAVQSFVSGGEGVFTTNAVEPEPEIKIRLRPGRVRSFGDKRDSRHE